MDRENAHDFMVCEKASTYTEGGDDFVFEIKESIGVLRKSNTGWTRELNVVSWNGNSPRYDIRDWSPGHDKMSRGITFTKEEAAQICNWLTLRMEEKPAGSKGINSEDGTPF